MSRITKRLLKRARLGDKVERVAKAIGVDRLAKVYEEKTGKPCGCGARKAALNGGDEIS